MSIENFETSAREPRLDEALQLISQARPRTADAKSIDDLSFWEFCDRTLEQEMERLGWFADWVRQGKLGVNWLLEEAIRPYYSPLGRGLFKPIGDIAYRASDFLPLEAREAIHIYPSPTGTVVLENGDRWDSCEDWRHHWEHLRGGTIPLLHTILDIREITVDESVTRP